MCWRWRETRAALSVAARVSSAGNTMTGLTCSFPSSSDAPVCASLVWVASAKSSLLVRARADDRAMTTSMEKRAKDNHPRSRHWPSARCPRKQDFYWRLSMLLAYQSAASPRGLQPHCLEATNVRLSSMFPASVGLSRVSHGWYHRLCTECLAHEVHVDTRPRETQLRAVISGNDFQSLSSAGAFDYFFA